MRGRENTHPGGRVAAEATGVPFPPDEKCSAIGRMLEGINPIGVAYSGGVDSTFLAWFLRERLGKKCRIFFVDSVFVPAAEREEALRVAEQLGFDVVVLSFDPLASAAIHCNPVDRCYFCKKGIFGRILSEAFARGCRAIVDGSHGGDTGAYRPGRKALSELGVLSPLEASGLVKSEIRELSRRAGLPNWNKPSQSCLATRFPYGTELTRDKLRRVESAEDFLRTHGWKQVRVRCHGDLARIEMEHSDFEALLEIGTRVEIVEMFRALGFSHVTLDLGGFRSGSWDETGPVPAR